MARDGFVFKLTGIEEVKRNLEAWERSALASLISAVDSCGEDLLQKSKALAPKLTGDLEDSGAKNGVTVTATEASTSVGFHKIYAARRHEEAARPGLITRGKPDVDGMRPGRKYLARPLQRYAQRYLGVIANALRSVTGGQ